VGVGGKVALAKFIIAGDDAETATISTNNRNWRGLEYSKYINIEISHQGERSQKKKTRGCKRRGKKRYSGGKRRRTDGSSR